MKINDKISLGKRTIDSNGFVSVPAVITKVGVQKYHVSDLMRDPSLAPHLSGVTGLVNVFRGKDVVFNPLTIDSFKNVPVTLTHPDEMVSPENAKFSVSGHIGESILPIDDSRLGCTIYLHDKNAISYSFGSETSAGYECPIVHCEKSQHGDEEYDFKFDGAMIGNHLALVPAGRCGEDCGVLDNKHQTEKEMEKSEVKTLIADALAELDIGKQIGDAVAKIDLTKTIETVVATKLDAVAQAKTDAEESAQKKLDQEKQTQVDADSRLALHVDLKQILDDAEYDTSKTDKELMVLAIGDSVAGADSKSHEYLVDKVHEIAVARKDATPAPRKDAKSGSTIKLRAFGKK